MFEEATDVVELDDVKTIVVRKYGLLTPINWDEDCDAELYRMNALWNRLVEIEHNNRQRYFEIVGNDSKTADLQTAIEHLLEARQDLIDSEKRRSQAARKRLRDPDVQARIAELTKQIKELSVNAKAARVAARNAMAPALKELEEERREYVKEARQKSGLWWGNYNAVCNSYEVARSKALKSNAELRFHRFDGSGRIVNQVQGGMSVDDLFTRRSTLASVVPPGHPAWQISKRDHKGRQPQLTLTIFTRDGERRTATWPIVMHRPIPDDCRIKEIVVTKRKLAHQWRWEVVFTCTRMSAPVQPSADNVTAVNFGFRRMNSGLRIATIVRDDDVTEFITLPFTIVGTFDYLDGIRSHRDNKRNEMVTRLRKIDRQDAPEPLAEMLTNILRAPKISAGRLASLAIQWRNHDWCAEGREDLEEWRRFDKRQWLEEVNLRDKIIARRLDYYRNIALRLVSASRILLLDPVVKGAQRRETVSGEPSPLTDTVRRMSNIAATHSLRMAIINVAQRIGTEVRIDDESSTFTCHVCDTQFVPRDRTQLIQTCPHCSTTFDQDVNNCRTKLRRYSESESNDSV
jgi:hypothetical protein